MRAALSCGAVCARWLAAVLAAVSGGLLCAPAVAAVPSSLPSSPPSSPLISAEEARALVEGGQADIVDARDLALSVWAGHAPGAAHLPWRALVEWEERAPSGALVESRRVAARLSALGLSPARLTVVYGDWGEGWGEEGRALWTLEYMGHERVRVVEGGWRAWRAAGGGRALGPARPRCRAPGGCLPADWRPRPELRATTEELPALLAAGAAPVDARALEEFNGAAPHGEERGGRLPGARHLEWSTLIDGARLRSPAELRALLAAAGVPARPTAEEPLVLYCTGGVRSGFLYLALRAAGVRHARNYDGSWWEWARLHPQGPPRLPPRPHTPTSAQGAP